MCVDLYRVLAHACAWKVSTGTSKFKSRTVYWLILAFLVHVCADLYRVHVHANLYKVLAHACAWEVRRVTSKFKSRTVYWLILAFLVHVCADLYRV